jgi:hypothetical protein
MKKLFAALGVFFGATIAAVVAFGGGMPLLPSNPIFSEPSQIVGTINTLMSTLNGAPTTLNNNTPVIQSLGAFCTATGATPQTCNAQRGTVSFTGVTVTNAATAALVINNSLITAASVCQANITTGGTNAAQSTPFVTALVSTAGVLTATLGNGSATSTGASTIPVSYNCIQ